VIPSRLPGRPLMSETERSKRTPVFEWHRANGARLVDFAGWLLPVQYDSLLSEHRAVREAAGLFDVSHMGELWVRGPDAEALVQWLTPNDVARLKPGRAQYSGLLNERGGYVDDLLVYRVCRDEFLLVVNAANLAADLEWILQHSAPGSRGDVEVEDASAATGLLALQGPRAVEILAPVCDSDPGALGSFGFLEGSVAGVRCLVSRTGYTGEDGFEIYLPAERTLSVWEELLRVGAEAGLLPVGLGARDTLRLEAGLMLHGNDIDTSVSPLEAGLSWVVKLDREDFLGRDALLRQHDAGVERRLIGFELLGRRIARHDAPVFEREAAVGRVTSGTFSPTLGRPIGMALVSADRATIGRELEIEVRGKREAARVVELPFYRRTKVAPGGS